MSVMSVMSLTAVALVLAGVFFLVVAAIGMVRLPDVFARSHALSLTDSLGALLVLSGLALYQGVGVNLFKILAVLGLIYLLNPVITHATVRAALRSGLTPWVRKSP